MKNLIIIFCLICFGCSPYQEKHISEFKIDNNLLQDGELVEIIYNPKSPDYNTNLEYFVKAIVVSKETNDTINVLMTNTEAFLRNDSLRNFIPYDSDANKVFEHVLSEHMNGNTLDDFNVNDLGQKKIEKVLLNKDSLYMEDNKYPTTIGALVHITDNK